MNANGTRSSLTERLRDRRARVSIWGAGYTGLSTALSLAREGIRVIAVDIDLELVDTLNRGIIPFPRFEEWLGIPIGPYLANGALRVVNELAPNEARETDVHIVCVNSDLDDRPYAGAVDAVLATVAGLLADDDVDRLVTIESTIAPGWLEAAFETLPALTRENVHVAVAPRRDYFLLEDRDLRSVPRVIGTVRPESREPVRALYGHLSTELRLARDWRHASIVKAVENTFRFMSIVVANQLAMAFADLDITEVLSLAATKWNMPLYHPSFGIAGYCVPLAPLYLLEDVADSLELPLLRDALAWDERYAQQLAERLAPGLTGTVGILGLAYGRDTRIYKRSAGVRLAQALASQGADVRVHDPFLTPKEVAARFGLPWLDYPAGLGCCAQLLLVTGHTAYADLLDRLAELASPPAVLDNLGELHGMGVSLPQHYREMGAAGWPAPPSAEWAGHVT